MTWEITDTRKIKITISNQQQNYLNVMFSINGEQKDKFQQILIDYLKFVESNDGVIKKVNEIIDTETSKRDVLDITINGLNCQLFAQELQYKTNEFQRLL